MSIDPSKIISIFLNGARTSGREISERFKEMAREAKASIVRSNKQASVALYQKVLRNFQEEGALFGGWEPLAPATIAYKTAQGYSKMLQNTGEMRNSFLPYSDEHMAMVGSPLIKAAAHDQGLGRVPQRRLLPNQEETTEVVMPIYGREMKIVTGRRL